MNTEEEIRKIFSYKEYRREKNGNYCLKFPLWKRVLSLTGFIFALLFFYAGITALKEGKISAFMGSLVFTLCSGSWTGRIFFKMELTDTEFVIRHWFKLIKIPFYQLKKYFSDPDFFIFIYPETALLKIGNNEYILIPMLSLKPIPFLEKLFEEKLGTKEKATQILIKSFIEIDISPKTYKEYLKRTVLILGITFILIFIGALICISLFASMPYFIYFFISALIVIWVLLLIYYTNRKMTRLSGEREIEKIYYKILKEKLEKRNKKILFVIIFICAAVFFVYFYINFTF